VQIALQTKKLQTGYKLDFDKCTHCGLVANSKPVGLFIIMTEPRIKERKRETFICTDEMQPSTEAMGWP